MKENLKNYTVIFNGIVLTPVKEIKDGVVVIQDKKIVDVGQLGELEVPQNAILIDAGGNYITPGMIDIHVNGGNGGDFSKVGPSTFDDAGTFFASHGVTSYLATAITGSDEDFLQTMDLVRKIIKAGLYKGAEVLGVHMEGPFLSHGQSGAHPKQFLSVPTLSHYSRFLEYHDVLKKMTIAPELEGSVQLVKDLRYNGIIAAAGHTDGIYSEMIGAIDAGITHATHSFCNMSHFRRNNLKRVAGAAETLLYDDRVTGELIGDGWHLEPTLMNLLVKVKGPERVCFVTDAMPAAGLPDGKHYIGEVEAIVENGIARLPDNSAYAGSVTTMDICLRNGVTLMGLPLTDSLRMCTLTPAEIIGVAEKKGSIEKNKDADLMIINKDFNVLKTIARGKLVFASQI